MGTPWLQAWFISPIVLYQGAGAMLLAFALAWVVSKLYQRTHTGMGWEPSFLATLVLLGPVVALVMMFIQGDLVLSLGLVGSLSIIRFRTPIKDARDMVFLFWVIAIGLGAGTLHWSLTTAGSALLAVLTILLFHMHKRQQPRSDYVLVLSGEGAVDLPGLEATAAPFCSQVHLRSHDIHGEAWEAVYELKLVGQASTADLVQQLKSQTAVERVSLLAPELSLPA